MQSIPVEADRPPKLQAQDNRTGATQCKLQRNKGGKKRNNVPLTGQDTGVSREYKRDSTIPTEHSSETVVCIMAVRSNQTGIAVMD